MEKPELKKLLLESTEKLIAQLSEILDKNSGLYNEMIILSKKYYEGKMEINLGTIKFEDWNILKTQVDVGLLDLIDRIQKPVVHEKKQNTKQKNIIVEDTIKWLSNTLLGQGKSSKEVEKDDYSKTIIHQSVEIEKVIINNEGDFNISQIQRYKSLHYYDNKNTLQATHDYCKTETILGSLRDVKHVYIIEEVGNAGSYVSFTSVNKQKSFLLKIEEKDVHSSRDREVDTSQKIDIKNVETFDIKGIQNLKSAEGIKNAFDYLAIHFGRKEDAF